VDGTTHLQALNHGDGLALRPWATAPTRIDCMIRGRVVTRLINQKVCREKRTNRDLKPPIRVLRIGRCGGGCAWTTGDDVFKITPSPVFVKTVVDRFVPLGACTLEGPTTIALSGFAVERSRP
jgi:hypothetical protein